MEGRAYSTRNRRPPPVPPPIARFQADVRNGDAPLVVHFTDGSLGVRNAWRWDLGDGTISTVQNPVHTYAAGGSYTVSLKVSNQAGSSVKTKPNYITVNVPPPPPPPPPDVDFTGFPLTGPAPLTTQFNDLSQGNPTGWLWNFGDGQTSTLQNPQHTYAAGGSYDVTLTATNAGGSDSLTKFTYVTATVTPFAPTRGCWGVYGDPGPIPAALVANKGVVGIGIEQDWPDVHTGPGTFDFSVLDDMLAQSAAAGFKVMIAIVASHAKTPQWVIDATAPSDKIGLIDKAPSHSTFCQPIITCLPWSDPYRQARLDLLAAAGAHFSGHPAVEAYMVQWANHHSSDMNVQDEILVNLQCPACPQPPPRLCGPQSQDQPAVWLAAGWTEQKMLDVGIEIFEAAAQAWPKQRLELPIGGLKDPRMATDYSSIIRSVQDYVYGNPDTGGGGRPYKDRFFLHRQIFLTSWQDGTYYLTHVPGVGSQNYLRYIIAYRARPDGPFPTHAGLQCEYSATQGPPNCDLQGGPTGSCGSTCPPVCVMQAAFDKARTYNTDRLEVIYADVTNPALYDTIRAGTIAMGGTPRP